MPGQELPDPNAEDLERPAIGIRHCMWHIAREEDDFARGVLTGADVLADAHFHATRRQLHDDEIERMGMHGLTRG